MISTGNDLTHEEIRNSVYIFMLAGHETSAGAASAAIYFLGKYPEYQKIAREEVDTVVGTKLPTGEDVKKLVFIEMFAKEVMRYFGPSSGLLPRFSTEDTVIDDTCLPAGVILLGSIYAVHHSSEFWPNPSNFDPYRFSAENSVGRHLFAFMPFGQGKRHCIALDFAMTELKIILCMLLQRFEIVCIEKASTYFTATTQAFQSVKVKIYKRELP